MAGHDWPSIYLDDRDMDLCEAAAKHRLEVAERRHHRPNNVHNDPASLLAASLMGVKGELAVARYVGLEGDWHPFDFAGIDLLDRLEIKTRRRGKPLHIPDRDLPGGSHARRPSTAYVLVWAYERLMMIRGWITLDRALDVGEMTPPFPNYPTLKVPTAELDIPDRLIEWAHHWIYRHA